MLYNAFTKTFAKVRKHILDFAQQVL